MKTAINICLLLALITPCWLVAESSWDNLPAMPLPVQEIYPALYQQQFVVAGGLSSELRQQAAPVTALVQRFDLATEQWQLGPSLPEPRHHSYLAVVGQQLYSFGGFIVTDQGWWTNSADILKLDPETQQWQKIAELPAPLSEAVVAVIDNRVHLASGRTAKDNQNGNWRDNTDVDWHWIFDPLTLQTQSASAIPTARNSAAGALLAGRWHVVGGRTVQGGNLAVHEMYDPVTASWQQLAPLPEAQAGLAAAVVNGHLLVMGGEHFVDGGGVFTQVWQYSVAEDRWQAISMLPIPRHGHGALAVDNQLYLLGGAAKAGLNETLNQLQRLTITESH